MGNQKTSYFVDFPTRKAMQDDRAILALHQGAAGRPRGGMLTSLHQSDACVMLR